MQTQNRHHRTRHLIRVYTVCFNYKMLRVKWNSLEFSFKTIFWAYAQRQSTFQCCQYFDYLTTITDPAMLIESLRKLYISRTSIYSQLVLKFGQIGLFQSGSWDTENSPYTFYQIIKVRTFVLKFRINLKISQIRLSTSELLVLVLTHQSVL